VWRAFARGRHTRNLYRTEYDEALLETKLGEVRARLALDADAVAASAGDRVAFAAWSALAAALFAATLAGLLAPVVLLVRAAL
jgi:hypothetical protein